MWTCSLLKTNAKQALRGRYWRCFWICLVLGLVGVGGSSASTGGSRYTMDTVTGSDTAYDRVANYLDSLSYQMLMTILIVAVLAAVISLLWSIFGAAPLEVGRDRYFMESRQALSPAATVTSVFRTPYMNVVKVQFLKNLKIFVGTLLFVVPGIYWDYCYALVPYLLAENPYMTTTRAMQLSKDIMDGEKFHYFVLGLSFAGWILLCMFTWALAISSWSRTGRPPTPSFTPLCATRHWRRALPLPRNWAALYATNPIDDKKSAVPCCGNG